MDEARQPSLPASLLLGYPAAVVITIMKANLVSTLASTATAQQHVDGSAPVTHIPMHTNAYTQQFVSTEHNMKLLQVAATAVK